MARHRRRRPRTGRETQDPTELARRAANGDREAAERFVAATSVDVWRLCAHLVDPQAADDLLQATYERALPALPRFRGDASARTWLLSIARRVCADEIRARTRARRRDGELVTLAAPDRTDPVAVSDLRLSIRRLADERRDAFVLTQVLGLPYAEAAEVLDRPIGTIRSQVARARADLRRSLDEDVPDVDRAAATARGV